MGRKRKNIVEQETTPKIEQQQEEEKVDAVPQLLPQVIEQHDRVDREYFDRMPPGYRFVPTGEELIANYLNIKVSDLNSLPINRIRDINIYDYHPRNLTSVYKLHRGKEWYFFTPRYKKYPNGQRPDRAAGYGYWKATGADVAICNDQGIKIGTKKTLVYYEGKAKENNGIKTDWIMHEYRNQVDNLSDKKDSKDMKLDECVLCKIYNKSSTNDGEANDIQQVESNMMIVPAENTINQGQDGASFFNRRTNLFVQNQNIRQRLDGGSFYNMPRQNVQVPNPSIIQRQDGTRVYNIASTFPAQNVQVPNPNIIQRQDGTRVYSMASNFPAQNVQVQNPNITHGLDGRHFYHMAGNLPAQNVQVQNYSTNQFPYGAGFANTASLPSQNDGLDVVNNLHNIFRFPPSYYDQKQNVYGRNEAYYQSLGNNYVNNQQVISPDPLQIRQAQYRNQNQIFPSQDMGMDSGVKDLFGDGPFDTPSQESLQGEEQTESQNYQPDYSPPLDSKDEVSLDSKDGEVGGADQAALSSKEKKN